MRDVSQDALCFQKIVPTAGQFTPTSLSLTRNNKGAMIHHFGRSNTRKYEDSMNQRGNDGNDLVEGGITPGNFFVLFAVGQRQDADRFSQLSQNGGLGRPMDATSSHLHA